MSELNEDLLDDDIDYPDLINEEEERLLLGDDEDLDESVLTEKNDSRLNKSDAEDKTERNKFSTERKKITAPENSSDTPDDRRKQAQPHQKNTGFSGRGNRGRHQRPFNNRKNKTVLINPRFQGILHVNNNNVPPALVWESQHQNNPPPLNPWISNAESQNIVMGRPQQMMQPPPMPQFQLPPQPQPCQGIQMSYWDGQNQIQYTTSDNQMPYQPERQVFVPQPVPIIINTAQPPPPLYHNPPFQQYPQQPPPFNHHLNQNHQFAVPAPVPPRYPPFESPKQFPIYRPDGPQNRNGFQGKAFGYADGNRYHQGGGNLRAPERGVKSRIGAAGSKFKKTKKESEGQAADRSPVIKTVPVKEEPFPDDEDDELREYRLKIEEQKRKREEYLRQKEAKRLKALGGAGATPPLPAPGPFPQLKKQKSPNIVVTNGFSRRLSKYQKTSKGVGGAPAALTTVPVTEDAEVKIDVKQLPGFLQDRRVLQKDEALPPTRRVSLRNLSTSTGDKKILSICRGIGDVQSLERDKDGRQATILFKSIASAHAFFKKYQRYMLDLSVIDVSLSPENE